MGTMWSLYGDCAEKQTGTYGQLHEGGDQGRRHVVHAEHAPVFQGVDGLGLSCAGLAGDEYEVPSWLGNPLLALGCRWLCM